MIMNNEFDFDKTGKRLPYTVPEGFFEAMENELLDKVKASPADKPTHPGRYRRMVLRLIASAAAVLLMSVIVGTMSIKRDTVAYSDVERAFNNLSSEDQNYMIALYQDDIFINE